MLGALLAGIVAGCGERDTLDSIRSLQRAGRWRDSAEALRRLVEQQPDDARVYLEYGKALMAAAEPTRAIWPLRRAALDATLSAEAGILLAQALLASANAEDAIKAASAVLDTDEHNPGALFARSRAYIATKRHQDALVDADLFVDLKPDDPQGRLLQLGILLMLENESEAAAAIADAAPLFDPSGPLNDESKARFCMLESTFTWERGDRSEGQAQAEVCLAEFSEQALVIENAVSLFDRAEMPERATAILSAALDRDPRKPKLRLALAQRMRALGELNEAERLLQEGTSLLPGSEPWLALHDHYIAREDYARAREAIEQALALDPDPPAAVVIAFADDLILTGELDRAEEVAAKLAPPGSNFVRGRILLARNDAAGALRQIEAGLPLWPDNPTARWLAGQAAEQLGNFSAAISHYRESVRSDAAHAEPARSPAARELAEIYAAMGAGRDAIDFAQRHLEANPQDPAAASLLLDLSRRFQSEPGRVLGLKALSSVPSARGQFLAERAVARAAREGPDAGIELIEASPFEGWPDEIDLIRTLAALEREAGRPAASAARVQALLDRDGDTVPSLLLLADVLEQSNAPLKDRRAPLERAAELAPSDPRVLLSRARLAAASGETRAALDLFDAIPEDATEFAAGRLESALLLRSTPEPDAASSASEAQSRLETALVLEPRNPQAALELARILAESDERSDRALELARRATLMGGGVPAAGLVGRLWVERGELRLAIESLEVVTSTFPDDAFSHYWLARAREGDGDRTGAREAYERALELGGLNAPEREHAEHARARLVPAPGV